MEINIPEDYKKWSFEEKQTWWNKTGNRLLGFNLEARKEYDRFVNEVRKRRLSQEVTQKEVI